MWIVVVAAVLLLSVGAYFLFRRTMNVLQYDPWRGHLYWISRDNGVSGTPHIQRYAFMRGTSPPWKESISGLQIRVGTYTFQFGRCRDAELEDPDDEIAALEHVLSYRGPDVP